MYFLEHTSTQKFPEEIRAKIYIGQDPDSEPDAEPDTLIWGVRWAHYMTQSCEAVAATSRIISVKLEPQRDVAQPPTPNLIFNMQI
jgi:hypothetical protein